MGQITTHVLDTARGMPGSGIRVDLYRDGEQRSHLKTVHTNADGRTDEPLLGADAFGIGTYELEFSVGDYFARSGATTDDPPFLDRVTLRFTAGRDAQYHVPLLVSPWSYSTYRGS